MCTPKHTRRLYGTVCDTLHLTLEEKNKKESYGLSLASSTTAIASVILREKKINKKITRTTPANKDVAPWRTYCNIFVNIAELKRQFYQRRWRFNFLSYETTAARSQILIETEYGIILWEHEDGEPNHTRIGITYVHTFSMKANRKKSKSLSTTINDYYQKKNLTTSERRTQKFNHE